MSVQLRLGFAEPTTPLTLRLSCTGVRVEVECSFGTVNDAHAYLSAAGLDPEMSSGSGLSFPLASFTEIVHLPERVTVFADSTLRPLLEWVENPCDDNLAAELDVESDGSLWMRWTSAGAPLGEPLSPDSAAAVLGADIPFVATDAAFELLRTTCHLPLLVGRCSTNRAGYIDIETSKPQLVETSGMTGLFRIDETHYGLPLPQLPSLAGRAGFVWDGPAPRLDSGPRVLPPMPARLSRHAASDLRPLVDALAAYRSQVVCWDSGLGRRVFALAALEALDAFPVLVVCGPTRLWQWWRHAALFGRSVSLTDAEADIHLMTYADFAENPTSSYFAQSLVFDDVASPQAAAPEVAAAAVGIGGMLDCYLVGITDTLPVEPKQLVSVMARLRPAEFSTTTALVERYGTGVRDRLAAHAESYVSRRSAEDPGKDQALAMFNHTQVLALEMPRQLRKEYDQVADTTTDDVEAYNTRAQMCSVGSRYTMSPKIATAMEMASTSVDAGRRVAVVAAHPEAAALLVALLRPYAPQVASTDNGLPIEPTRLAVVSGSGPLPNLSRFDEVIVLDYPASFSDLDSALGDPSRADAPLRVTCLHITDSVDDDRALMAARRAVQPAPRQT